MVNSHIIRDKSEFLGKSAVLKLFVAYFGLCLTLTMTLWNLLKAYGALRRSQVLVVMPEGGFGHTIIGPDSARRLFRGKRCTYLIFSEYKRHNWKVSYIWPDVRLIFLPLNVGVDIKGRVFAFNCIRWYKQYAPQVISMFLRGFISIHAQVLTLHELYSQLPMANTLKQLLEKELPAPFNWWPIAYIKLIQEVPAPQVRLPERWRIFVRRKLDQSVQVRSSTGQLKLCCLYLRQKGVNSTDVSQRARVGSSLREYTEGIEVLVRAGHMVLLTGDIALDHNMYQKFDGMLVDAKHARVDSEVFGIYAATEANVFVGEVGGGTWLPGINCIPRLILNAFPYFYGFPKSWMCYKRVTDQAGRLVHFRELFSSHAYDYNPAGTIIHENSREEIRDAISCFVKTLSGRDDFSHDILPDPSLFPEKTWIRHAGANLSPAWLRAYGSVEFAMVNDND